MQVRYPLSPPPGRFSPSPRRVRRAALGLAAALPASVLSGCGRRFGGGLRGRGDVLSRFAELYDTSRCTRLLGFAPAHGRRPADAVAEGSHRSSRTEGT
ncbi:MULTISPECIES: hypothetical protein [Streptomyces]|uniref:hypothetical protein n=1 Tax=Streptomyces TaxID=1883 RepID=UPI00163C53C0|nr:hypothetical protein [Streptomyces sp. WAC05858]